MADKRPKLSTCPICGYTDTADDAEALQMAIEEHIRMAHNLDPATLGGMAGSVKSVSEATAAEASGNYNERSAVVPAIALAPNSGGSGVPTTGIAPGVALLGIDETTDTNGNAEDRLDHTSRF